jgi:hypothetical protein
MLRSGRFLTARRPVHKMNARGNGMIKNLLSLGLAGVILSAGLGGQVASSSSADPSQLGLVLKSAREYCGRLEKAALDFVCLEEVTEILNPSRDRSEIGMGFYPDIWGRSSDPPTRASVSGNRIPTKVNNTYLYDYQFIRREGKIEEKRALLEKNGHKADDKTPRPEVSAFNFTDILLGPVRLLDERFVEFYAYRLLGREKAGGTEAWVLEVSPRLTGVPRYLGGKIWISIDDSSVLRIEWDPSTFGNFESVQATAKSYKAEPEVRSYSEFGILKKGLRFPSADLTEEAYRGDGGKLFVRARTGVVYREYKFFTVETQTAIKQ